MTTQHAARSTQHAARSTQHAARSTQHAARSTQHAARSTVLLWLLLAVITGCSSGEDAPSGSVDQGARFQCKTKSIQIVEHPGPTRGIWEGWETVEAAPGLGRTPELVFVFDQKVDPNGVAGAATLRALECDEGAPSDVPIPLTAEAVAPGFEHVVRVRPLNELERGCLYELSFGGDAGLTTNGRCLAEPRELTFRTRAPGEPSALQREATEVRYLPRSFEVSAFKLLPDVHWPATILFERYAEELGLRIFLDSFAPMAEKKPSVLYSELTYRPYRQMYLGVPIIGAAYSVHEDAEDAVRLVTGTPMLDVTLDPSEVAPRVTRESAIGKAKAAALEQKGYVGRPPGFESEEAELIITTVDPPPAPRELQLVWQVMLELSGHPGGIVVLIDAHSGRVLAVRSTLSQACTSADRSAMLLIDDDVTGNVQTPQAQLWDDPTAFQMSEYETSGGAPVYVLEGNGFGPGSPPRMFTQCNQEDDPLLATVPATQSDASWGYIATAAASSHMAVQRCLAYFATRNFRGSPNAPLTPDTAWLGLDGVAQLPISVRVGDWKKLHNRKKDVIAAYDWLNKELLFEVPDDPTSNVPARHSAIDIACHEFGHGVLHEINAPAWATNLEWATIHEGYADVVGLLVKRSVRGDGPWTWCAGGDEHLNQRCYRNVDSPKSHLDTPQPDTYLGDHYYCAGPGDVPTNVEPDDAFGFCTHHNSTILSHWFYLLATGGSGVNDRGCSYALTPLLASASLQASLDGGELVLFHALGEHTPSGSGFVALATATLSAAKAIFGDSADEVRRVARTWAAVGVWEDFWEGENDRIVPARGGTDVNPWAPIRWIPEPHDWIPEPHEMSWDIQIFTGPDLASDTLYAEATVDELVTVDGKDYATYHIALEPQTRYYWRVRPHMASSWQDCYPVHFFDTGDLPAVTDLAVTGQLAEEGLVRPGRIDVEWRRADGSTGYALQADTTNPRCASTSSTVIVGEVEDNPFRDPTPAFLVGIQPSETYWLTVNPIGPDDPTGAPATGPCAEIQFTTAPMRPPFVIRPDGGVFNYRSPHGNFGNQGPLTWGWVGLDGPDRYELRFFDRDPLGTCGSVALAAFVIDESCDSTCGVTVDDDLFPVPNPTGYCWDVISIAANGKTSDPSETLAYEYGLSTLNQIAPGVHAAAAELEREQGPLIGHSYGDPVTFSWIGDPDAAEYLLKLGRWPWRVPTGIVDPPNCYPTTGHFCTAEPTEVTYREFVRGTAVTIDGARAGMGRYCWQVWPVLQDPENPGMVSVRQPLVQAEAFCYTTGPAQPEIEVDNMPSGSGFSCEAITGRAIFPYLPGGSTPRFEGHVTPGTGTFTWSEGCTVEFVTDPFTWTPDQLWIFGDRRECTVEFVVQPNEGATVTLRAGATGVSGASGDDVEAEPLSFSLGTCGNHGDPCCTHCNSPCKGPFRECWDGTCQDCGGKNEPCCREDDPCEVRTFDPLQCMDGTCRSCGREREPCCAGAACAEGTCLNGRCEIPESPPDDCSPLDLALIATIEQDGQTIPIHHYTPHVALDSNIDGEAMFSGVVRLGAIPGVASYEVQYHLWERVSGSFQPAGSGEFRNLAPDSTVSYDTIVDNRTAHKMAVRFVARRNDCEDDFTGYYYFSL
jgi:Zn-dependent metalloprotease